MFYAIINNVFRHDLKQYNKEFTDNHLLLLVYIQKFKTYSGGMDFCLGWIFDDLKINYNLRQDLISCFTDLVKWDLITLITDVDKINRNTRLQVLIPEYDNRFTQILFVEVEKIFNLDIDIRTKKTMLFLYVDIASWIDSKKYCYTSYYYFMQDLNTKSNNRVHNSLELLKKYKLIDYERVGEIVIDGRVTTGNNIYVLCSDEDYKSNLARGLANRKKDYEEKNAKIFKGEQSNNQRSVRMRLNNLWSKNHNNTINYDEYVELDEKQKEYKELIKHDEVKLAETPFVEIDFSKFSAEDKEIIDIETGEIIEVDSLGESNPMIDNMNYMNDFYDTYGTPKQDINEKIDKQVEEWLGAEIVQDISYLEVQLQNIEKVLRYYKSNFDNLTKVEKEKAKELVGEYKRLKLELGA